MLLVSMPGIVLLLVFGPFLLPDQKAPQAGRPDPVSSVLSLAAILPSIYGLKELAATAGSGSPLWRRCRVSRRGWCSSSGSDAWSTRRSSTFTCPATACSGPR